MKIFLTYFLCATMLWSCSGKENKTNENTSDTGEKLAATAEVRDIDLSQKDPIGSYSGSFGDTKITILLSAFYGDSVSGRSIVSGNDRPFAGIATQIGGVTEITAKEPGTDRHDGTFKIRFDNKAPDKISGSWAPFDSKVTPPKNFNLVRRSFVYNTSVGNYPEASTKLLTEEDLMGYGSYDLYLMRNEIFARHGYCFSRKESREEFENTDWYVPASIDVRNELTEIEKKNIKQILKLEKYYDEHGDDFGR